jgi:hypothetical protein
VSREFISCKDDRHRKSSVNKMEVPKITQCRRLVIHARLAFELSPRGHLVVATSSILDASAPFSYQSSVAADAQPAVITVSISLSRRRRSDLSCRSNAVTRPPNYDFRVYNACEACAGMDLLRIEPARTWNNCWARVRKQAVAWLRSDACKASHREPARASLKLRLRIGEPAITRHRHGGKVSVSKSQIKLYTHRPAPAGQSGETCAERAENQSKGFLDPR